MYLLDTNTLIYFFKGLGNVAGHLFSKAPKDIAVSTIVLYELETGIAKSKDPEKRGRQLDHFVARVRILPFATREAKAAASIRAELENRGAPIGPIDTLIAGAAMASGAVLVTHNTKEFGRIQGLVVEDWF